MRPGMSSSGASSSIHRYVEFPFGPRDQHDGGRRRRRRVVAGLLTEVGGAAATAGVGRSSRSFGRSHYPHRRSSKQDARGSGWIPQHSGSATVATRLAPLLEAEVLRYTR
jgi:hypothetical protein